MNNLTAVILAGGQGKRLKPLVTPKPLLSFCGQPLINWIINDLESVGIKNIVIVASPKLAESFKTNHQVVIQPKPLGMADALLKAKPKIKTDSIVVLNSSDLLAPTAYQDFFNQINKTNPEILLTGLKLDHYLPGGYFKFDSNNKPVAIIEKPGDGKEPSPYVNLVLHYSRKADNFIPTLSEAKSAKDDVYEVALSKLMKKGQADLFEYTDYFVPIKFPHQILDMVDLFLNHRLNGDSFVHKTAKVFENAVIKNSYIGKNVVIGNNCLVRDSIIEEGSVVGYNTEVARSYVGPKTYFHCNYVGDSVIEGGSNMGSGARLANLRFDKKTIKKTDKTKLGAIMAQNSQLGINTSVMPGVTIGANSIIGSGVVLNQSVEPNKTVFVKQSLVTK